MKSAIVPATRPRQATAVVKLRKSEDRRILILADATETPRLFSRILRRNGVFAQRIDSGRECLSAAAQACFDLILVRIPISDLSVSALATGLNQRSSLNADTPLVLLADGKQYEAARGYASPRIRVIDIDSPATNLERLVSVALGVALRTSARLNVELDIETGNQDDRRQCRTRDISRSGMLLEGGGPLPLGTEFVFNFTLPERFTPIHGRGQVVRHAGENEPVAEGMGVKFVAFPEGAEEAIQEFVDQNRVYAR